MGVTVRALELGFRKELGKTPREFVREQRLLRARDELLRANSGDGTTVTGVACRWGFWHAGRFATSYTERFGPSRHDAAVRGRRRGSLTGTPIFGQRLGQTGSGL